MSPIYEPEAVKIQGAVKVTFCVAVADSAAPKLATEINAATSVEATMAAYGTFSPQYTINTGNSPVRIGTTVQLPQEGNALLQVIPLTYPHDPSVADTDPNNKLKALLVEGAEVYAVVRKGTDKDVDFAVANRVKVWKVRCGKQVDAPLESGDEFAEFTMAQNLVPILTEVEGVVAA